MAADRASEQKPEVSRNRAADKKQAGLCCKTLRGFEYWRHKVHIRAGDILKQEAI